MKSRITFLGSPEFAVNSLRAAADQYDVRLVITQPDRPAGRGRVLEPTAVRQAAESMGLPCQVYQSKNRSEIEGQMAKLELDALLVVAFGHILRPSTLALARCGAINVHASLLPRWRGVSPIERSIAAGDSCTGVTLMSLDSGVDTGPMLAQRVVPIAPEDDRVTLTQKLALQGADMVLEEFGQFLNGDLAPVAQQELNTCYAPKLEKNEGWIFWETSPLEIWNHVRAFLGWPGAFAELGGKRIKVHRVAPYDFLPTAEPGTIVRASHKGKVLVSCGSGTVELIDVQLPGKAITAARALVGGRVFKEGLQFSLERSG